MEQLNLVAVFLSLVDQIRKARESCLESPDQLAYWDVKLNVNCGVRYLSSKTMTGLEKHFILFVGLV